MTKSKYGVLTEAEYKKYLKQIQNFDPFVRQTDTKEALKQSLVKWHPLNPYRGSGTCGCCRSFFGLSCCGLCPLSRDWGCCAGLYRNWIGPDDTEAADQIYEYILHVYCSLCTEEELDKLS